MLAQFVDIMPDLLDTLKRSRSATKGWLSRAVGRFQEAIQSKEKIILVEELYWDVKAQWEKVKLKHDEYIIALGDMSIEKEQENEEWITKCEDEFVNIRRVFFRLKDDEANEKKQNQLETKDKDSSKTGLRLPKLEMPSFSGKIREYKLFKRMFQNNIEKHLNSEDEKCFALRSVLKGLPFQIVVAAPDRSEELWRRLDEEYDDVRRLVEAVIDEIRRFYNVEKRFIEFVSVIETGYKELETVKLEKEIANAAVMSLIESKLPERIKERWSLVRVEMDTFDLFLKFLIKEKQSMRYLSSSIRADTNRGFMNSYISEGGTEGCHIADTNRGSMNNYVSDGVTGGGGNNRGIGGCWLHNNSRTHSIEACKVFISMGVDRRIEAVRRFNACMLCLKSNHETGRCRSRERCGIEGCQGMHHRSLHLYSTASANIVSCGQFETPKVHY